MLEKVVATSLLVKLFRESFLMAKSELKLVKSSLTCLDDVLDESNGMLNLGHVVAG